MFSEEFDITVDELIDRYGSGEFKGDELKRVESHFLKAPERQRKVQFVKALKKTDIRPTTTHRVIRVRKDKTFLTKRYLAIAASIVAIIGVGFFVWRIFIYESHLKRGLDSLQAAYREQRPLEPRLSDFRYAPLANQRNGEARVDYLQRDLAGNLILTEAKNDPTAASLHALGQYYLLERKVDQAIDQFQKALVLEPNNSKIHADFGAALMEKGKIEASGPDKGKEFETYARSLDQLNKAIQIDSSLLEAFFNRALVYQYMLLPAQAESAWREYLQKDANSPWAEEARANLKRLEEERQKSSQTSRDALGDFMNAYRANNDDAAWKVINRSYSSAGNEVINRLLDSFLTPPSDRALPAPQSTLPVLAYVARLQFEKAGDRYLSDVVSYYERASPKLRPVLADARRHMSNAYTLFTRLRFAEAIDEYQNAKLKYEQAQNDVESIFVDYRIAHCYIFVPKLHPEAMKALSHLETLCGTRGYLWLRAQSLFGLAHVNADSREYSKAIDFSARALVDFERVGDLSGVMKSLTQLADVNQWLNRITRSLTFCGRGLALAGASEAAPQQKWGMLTQMAFNMSSMRLHAAALLYHQEALKLAFEMAMPLQISRSHGYLGSAYAELKMYDEALIELNKSFEIGQSIANTTGGLEIVAKSSLQLGDVLREMGEYRKAIASYDESIVQYGKLNSDYYQYAAHKGKLLCLMKVAEDAETREELQTVLALSNSYRSKITNQSQRESFFDMVQGVYDLAIDFEFTRVNDKAKAFDYSEESRARSLLDALSSGAEIQSKVYGPDLSLRGVTRQLSRREIQERIPSDSQILQYAVLDDRLVVWIVTQSQIQPVEKSVEAEALSEKVRAFQATLNGRPLENADRSSELSKELYQILIEPAAPYLDAKKFLCIVPDKALHYLAYEALVSPSTGQYLLEEYDRGVGISPSSSTFVQLSAVAKQKGGTFDEKLLSVGNPTLRRDAFESLVDLPSATREAKALTEFYPRHAVFVGNEANEPAIKSALNKADVAHFAMHYLLDEHSEMLSGFPLASQNGFGREVENPEGFLHSHEIYAMKLPRMRLVVLSACQTGIEQQYRGEGAIGAARPFLTVGVPMVVASLWPVDSDATAELMINFHRYRIREALPVAQALKRAQIDLARGKDQKFRHPYYWAAFQVIGGLSQY